MYKLKKVISLILVFALVLALPVSSFANKPDWANGNNGNSKWKNESSLSEEDEELKEEIDELNDTIKELEDLIKDVEDAIIELKKEDEDYEEDSIYLGTLYEKLAKLEKKLGVLEDKLGESEGTEFVKSFNSNKYNNLLRKIARKGYSKNDFSKLAKIKQQLENQYPGIAVLEVDSIFSEDVKFKFDTPPVIKDGRTLIPVAAIAKGFKAYVNWYPNGDGTEGDPEGAKVVIIKEDVKIELWIGSNMARITVGDLPGEIEILDAKATIMNSRTVVPLRFIAEALRLNVEWLPGDRSIKISDNKLKLDTIGFDISGKNIYIPEGTTAGALYAVLEEPEGGSFEIVDEDGIPYEDDSDDELSITDKVRTYDEDDKLTGIYLIKFIADTSLEVTDLGDSLEFSIDEDEVTIPSSTTYGALFVGLSAPSGEITLYDEEDGTLYDFDPPHKNADLGDLILETDVILVTAKDGTKQWYTIDLD